MKEHEDAKKAVRTLLHEYGIHYEKITAKKVDFSDLARGAGMFITVHGAEWMGKRQLVKKDLKGTGVLLDPNH